LQYPKEEKIIARTIITKLNWRYNNEVLACCWRRNG
jgi:hypothetical protein